jgi:hypothetical protein
VHGLDAEVYAAQASQERYKHFNKEKLYIKKFREYSAWCIKK